ncbi:hypothetical protein KIN20_028728 [Parelaphostrongylus tenuis]|uniref:Uncharacterized protein n=1 Tax=Parelaphostrongylus tenuis TaxID=148309 RepID=A0AAD5WF12_PARTN|nr:hypothetical protein KIN20_028728 [Parelaphostrongylus tenuis]
MSHKQPIVSSYGGWLVFLLAADARTVLFSQTEANVCGRLADSHAYYGTLVALDPSSKSPTSDPFA